MSNKVDGHRERGFVSGVVGFYHQLQPQFIAARLEKRGANQPTAVSRHEVDHFWRRVARGEKEIAFVFAILVVHDDDDFTALDGLDGLRDGVQLRHRGQR